MLNSDKSYQNTLCTVIIAAIVLLVLAAYVPGITGQAPFVLDDNHVIVDRKEIRSPVQWGRIWSGTLVEEDYYRPLLYTGFVINLRLQGELDTKPGKAPSITGLRLANLLLHIGTWLLAFGIARRLLEARRGESAATTLAAGAVAILGAVLPACSQAVLYVSARSSLQMTFFALLAFRLYLAVRLPRAKMLTKFQLAVRYVAMMLALIAAILTKEGAVVLPLVFLVFELLKGRLSAPMVPVPETAEPVESNAKSPDDEEPSATSEEISGEPEQASSETPVFPSREPAPAGGVFAAVVALAPTFVAAGGLLVLHAYFYFSIERPTGELLSYSPWSYFLTQFAVIVRYIQLIIIPVNLSIHHVVRVTGEVSAATAAAGIFLLLILAGGIVLAWRRPVYALGIFWFFIALIPTSSVFPIWDAMFEHRLYFPAFGFLLAVVPAVFYGIRAYEMRSSGRETITSLVLPGMVLGLVACLLTVITGVRAADWRDGEGFWHATEKAEPKSYYAKSGLARLAMERARENLADNESRTGDLNDAVKYYGEARKLWEEYLGEDRWKRKLYIRAVVAYAEALRVTGMKVDALKVLAEAGKGDRTGRVPTVWFSKGKALRELAMEEQDKEKRKQLNLQAGAAFNSYLNKASGFGNRDAHKLFLDTILDLKDYSLGDNATLDALQRFPKDYEFLKIRAEILAHLDRYREADEVFRRIMQDADFSDMQKGKMSYDFAGLLNKRKRYREALAAVVDAKKCAEILARPGPGERAAVMKPLFDTLILEAKIRISSGGAENLDRAIALLHQAGEINPTHSDVYDVLAAAYLGKNDLPKMKEAILQLLEILWMGQDNPQKKAKRLESYRALSLIAVQSSNYDEALRWIDRAIEENPDNEALKKAREQLKKEAEEARGQENKKTREQENKEIRKEVPSTE